ncbi:MAG TPA: protein kinase [Kofleriaceae bacterium]|nr:protein kinase [Kofleriaceae bacterium]
MSGGARRTSRFGLSVGQTAGSYRIVDELGGGGMGMVYVAEHVLIGRRAAVKVLRPEYGHVPEVVERFFNEARATTSIRHPGIVEVFDFGYTEDGHAFIVMELLDGVSLADHIVRNRRLAVATALVLARRIAGALAAAHARGVVHRDLKPDNIFLVADPDGGAVPQVKLLDFGIAKLGDDVSRTHTGVVLGTPLYMSPEQCRGASACDHRSDLYSLGCVLFEMITGRPPFLGEGAGEVLAGHLTVQPPDLRGFVPTIAAPVAELCARLLAKEPAARPESATSLVAMFERVGVSASQPTVIAPSPPRDPAPSLVVVAPRRPRRWLGSALVAGGLALGAVAAVLVRTGLRSTGIGERSTPRDQKPASSPDARIVVDAQPPADATVDSAPSVIAPIDAAPVRHHRSAIDSGTDDVTIDLGRPSAVDVDTTVPDDQRSGTSRR